jgi:hypothetical protein
MHQSAYSDVDLLAAFEPGRHARLFEDGRDRAAGLAVAGSVSVKLRTVVG